MPKAKRRAVTVFPVGTLRSEIEVTEVDNPHYAPAHAGAPWNPDKTPAFRNIRESAITTMEARGHLEPHQVRAANKFRQLWETLAASGAGAKDYTRELVDGGGTSDPIGIRQMEAGRKLAACRTVLGKRPYEIVSKVAGEGFAIAELGQSHRERTTFADYLKHALDDLAEHWGF